MRPLHTTFVILFLVLGMGSGCTIEVTNDSTSDVITEEDLQAARQIIGQSLSTDNSGVVLSINDALNIISQNNTSSSNSRVQRRDRSGLGNENNYQTNYNADTGIFTVIFQRMVVDPLFSKTVQNELTYLYRDGENEIIEAPNENSGDIASISYTASREGEIQTLQNEATFIHNDSIFVSGFNGTLEKTIEGTQASSGSVVINQTDTPEIKRFYELQLTFLNISIEKSLSTTPSVALGMTGNMSFRLKLWQSANKSENATIIEGTIQGNGDGTAILKFSGIAKTYILNLKNGDTSNLNEALEGQVTAVSISNQRVTLANGLSAYITEDTQFSAPEFPSLQNIQTGLTSDLPVWAKAKGTVENRKFIVETLFIESRDGTTVDREAPIQFRGAVTAVSISPNTGARFFTLENQVEVQLPDSGGIRTDSDYHSLDEVSAALEQDITVIAEGQARGYTQNTLYPSEVKFLDGSNSN